MLLLLGHCSNDLEEFKKKIQLIFRGKKQDWVHVY